MGKSKETEVSSQSTQTTAAAVNTTESQTEPIVNIELEMSTALLASIEKLRGRENYSTWKFAMEHYLAAEGMSGCLTDAETDVNKIAKAKGAIVLSIDKSNYVHVTGATTAKQAWDSLKKTFEDQGAVRKVTLMRKIVNTKLAECSSMEMYVTEIISTAQRLTEIGFTIEDEWLAIFLLTGLTEEYLPMIMTSRSYRVTVSKRSFYKSQLQLRHQAIKRHYMLRVKIVFVKMITSFVTRVKAKGTNLTGVQIRQINQPIKRKTRYRITKQ